MKNLTRKPTSLSPMHSTSVVQSIKIVSLVRMIDGQADGVLDYNHHLAAALSQCGHALNIYAVPWTTQGWPAALWQLWKTGLTWRGHWVVIQYTAFSWSQWGVPIGLFIIWCILRIHQARIAIVFHDPWPQPALRPLHSIRWVIQAFLMRLLYHLVDRSIHTIPFADVPWLPKRHKKAVFIPVGSNIVPDIASEDLPQRPSRDANERKTIAVFSITGGQPHRQREVDDIACVLQHAVQYYPIRLVIFGRGAEEATPLLRAALGDTPVEVVVYGTLPEEAIGHLLTTVDIYLFVRGPISSQRTTALAGVAFGLPIVGYAGTGTGFPFTEAGIVTVPYGQREALAQALVDVLANDTLQQELRQRSQVAYRDYFAWECIAQQYIEALSYDKR